MKSEVVEEAAERGVKLIVSVDTGIRANDVVRHAVGSGHRRDCHGSSPSRSGASARAGRAESQPGGLQISGKEFVWSGGRAEIGCRADDHSRVGPRAPRAYSGIADEAGRDRDGGRRGPADGRESGDRQARPGGSAPREKSGPARAARRGRFRRRRRPERPASRVSDRAPHQRRRTHGQRPRCAGAVHDHRRGPRPRHCRARCPRSEYGSPTDRSRDCPRHPWTSALRSR